MNGADRGHHDIGGDPAGPVPRAEHRLAPWEKEIDAIRNLLGQKGMMTADELRLGIERLPAQDYRTLSYYERWLASLVWTLERKGMLRPGAFSARVAAIEAGR